MKNSSQQTIAEVPRRQAKVEMTIGIDLGDALCLYCTLNQDGEVVDQGRFRTTPKAIEKWFTIASGSLKSPMSPSIVSTSQIASPPRQKCAKYSHDTT